MFLLTHSFEMEKIRFFFSHWGPKITIFPPYFSILCSSCTIIFCSRWYWWCYYFLEGTHPQLCKFLPQSLKASFKVFYKVHVPHSSSKFFLSKPLFVPKKFFFPKVIAKHLFPWKLPHKLPCQNELTRLLSMYSSLLSTVWWK